ncbi:MAG: ABC transporter substrate-binding protein [Lachnospiraceae bacterium]
MKKRFVKSLTGVVAISMAAVSLAACGGTATNSGQSTAENSGPITGQTLQVMLSEEPGEQDALGNALNNWAAESGNEVKKIVISHDDMRSKFPSMAKNKDLPDLISTTFLHQLYPDEFVNMDSVVDLSKFNQSALKIVGKSYSSEAITGITEQFTTTCIFYNKDAFAEAGIEAPTIENPWTWDELYENAAILQENSNVRYGFASDVSRARYDILMYANGGSLVEQDGDSFKITVNSPENVKTLERFIQANNEVMPKAIWAGGTTDNPAEYFKNGDAAILLSGSWNYNAFTTEISKFDFGVMPSPKGSTSQSAIIGGAALAIPQNAKNQELAQQFIQWLYEDEHYTEYLQLHKGLSVMNDISYTPESEKAKEDFVIIQNEANYVLDTFMVDESSSWRNYKDNEYRDSIKRAVAGEKTAQEALDGFAKDLAESSGWTIAY